MQPINTKRLDNLTAQLLAVLRREQATPDECIMAAASLAASSAAVAGVRSETLCRYIEALHGAVLQVHLDLNAGPLPGKQPIDDDDDPGDDVYKAPEVLARERKRS